MDQLNQNNDMMFPENFEPAETEDKADELVNKISDLSKKGYQLIKENDIEGAKTAFNEILTIDKIISMRQSVIIENALSSTLQTTMHFSVLQTVIKH